MVTEQPRYDGAELTGGVPMMSVSNEQTPWCIKVNEYTFQGIFYSIALLGMVLSSREANMKSQNCLPWKKWQKIRRCTPFI